MPAKQRTSIDRHAWDRIRERNDRAHSAASKITKALGYEQRLRISASLVQKHQASELDALVPVVELKSIERVVVHRHGKHSDAVQFTASVVEPESEARSDVLSRVMVLLNELTGGGVIRNGADFVAPCVDRARWYEHTC